MRRSAQKHRGPRPTLGGRRAPSRGEGFDAPGKRSGGPFPASDGRSPGRARPGTATPGQANDPRLADSQPTARMD